MVGNLGKALEVSRAFLDNFSFLSAVYRISYYVRQQILFAILRLQDWGNLLIIIIIPFFYNSIKYYISIMKKIWKSQETPYSCGPSALRNCLIFLGLERTEKYIRYLMGTTKEGSSEKNIIKGIKTLKLNYNIYQTKSFNIFRNKLIKALKNGNPCILLIDACTHWVAAIQYKNRKVIIIDSEFKIINQPISMSTIKQLANNFDKHLNKRYYYFIEILKPL